MTMGQISPKLRSLSAALLIPLIGTVLLGVGIWFAWSSYAHFRVAEKQEKRIIKLGGVIRHLGEVLTMSARLAAASSKVFS